MYLSAFALALVGSLAITPISIILARRFGAMDMPGPRKIHVCPTPRWGGIGIAGGFFLAIIILWAASSRFQKLLEFTHETLSLKAQLSGILTGAGIMLAVGLVDDKQNINPVTKLLLQIIAAYVAMVYGVRITGFTLPESFGQYFHLPMSISQILTVAWIVLFINSMNLVDGLDGLAAGLGVIVAGTFFIVALMQGHTKIIFFSKQLKLAGVTSAAVCGACLGFLVYNFNPARVFMGDSGAMFIGFLLGGICITGTLKTTAVVAFFIPLVALGHPVVEVAWTIYRRFRSKQGIMTADSGHLHQALLSRGWTQREIILSAYVIGLLLSLVAITLTIFRGLIA